MARKGKRGGKKKAEEKADTTIVFPYDCRFDAAFPPEISKGRPVFAARFSKTAPEKVHTLDGALKYLDYLREYWRGHKNPRFRDAWKGEISKHYHLVRALLKKGRYRIEFADFASRCLKAMKTEDKGLLTRYAKAFFYRYPFLWGTSGWWPVMSLTDRLEVERLFYFCRNCSTVTGDEGNDYGMPSECCENPELEPYYRVTLGMVGSKMINKRVMDIYRAKIETLVVNDMRSTGRMRDTRRDRLSSAPEFIAEPLPSEEDTVRQRVMDKIRYFKEECSKWKSDHSYDSPPIRILKDISMAPGLRLNEMVELLLQLYTEEHPEAGFPDIDTILRYYRL